MNSHISIYIYGEMLTLNVYLKIVKFQINFQIIDFNIYQSKQRL